MKYKLTAVIPVVQYGNIQPEIELEGDDVDVLHEQAMNHIVSVWDKYGEKKFPAPTAELGKKFTSFTGETVYYNDETHTYTDENGNVLLSGSKYADQFAKPFNIDAILPQFAKKNGWTEEKVADMWEFGKTLASDYGTTIHRCVEMLVKHGDTEYIDRYVPSELASVVRCILKLVNDDTMAEVLVTDIKNGRAGQIDLLKITDDSYIIQDIKTNREMKPEKLDVYARQLSFYADCLINTLGKKNVKLSLLHASGSEVNEIPLEYISTL